MKLIVLTLLAIFSLNSFASNLKISCTSKYNLDEIFQYSFELQENQKNLNIGRFNEFEVFISSLGDSKVELQLLNTSEPSRSFATTTLTHTTDLLELVIWKADYIFETKCKLVK